MDLGEDLLAQTGLSAYFNDAPLKFGVTMRKEALAIRQRMRATLRAFLTGGTEFDRAKAMPPFRFQRAVDLLSAPPTPEQMQRKLAKAEDPEAAELWQAVAQRSVAYLQAALPKRERETPVGPKLLPPSDMELARFRHAWEIAEDPMVMLEALAEGSLSRGMARQFAELWPDLYMELQSALPELLIAIKTQRPGYEIPWPREKQLRSLMGASWGPMVQDMQAAFGREKLNVQRGLQPQGQAQAPNIAGNVQTSVDRVSTK